MCMYMIILGLHRGRCLVSALHMLSFQQIQIKTSVAVEPTPSFDVSGLKLTFP